MLTRGQQKPSLHGCIYGVFRTVLVLALLSMLPALPAQADDSSQLQARLDGIRSLAGRFEQSLRDGRDGAELERGEGSFALLRPGYFRWAIESPDQQLFIAAAGYLWHHDIELETATRQTLDIGSTRNPLSILAGDSASLAAYSVAAVDATEEGRQAWRLTSQFDNPDFLDMVIVFSGDRPERMELTDPLQRLVTVVFSALKLNPGLTPEDFEFTPPEGVDIYSDG